MEGNQILACEKVASVETELDAMDVEEPSTGQQTEHKETVPEGVRQIAEQSDANQTAKKTPSEGTNQSLVEEQHFTSPTDMKAYEVQYFGFTPQSFANGVYNAMVDYLQDAVEVTQDYIMKEFASKEDVSSELVKQGSDRLFAIFIDTFNNTFDRLESYLLKNIFHIPSNVVLPEDKVNQEHQYNEVDESKIDTELEELRQKIQNAKYVNARLRQWMQEVEAVQAQLDTFVAQLNTWHAICKQNNVTNLAESITFVGSKMQRLQEELRRVQQQKKSWNQRLQTETTIQEELSKF